MELTIGSTLDRYELVSPIGKGGMGSVWKAYDARARRFIAIKVPTEPFTNRFLHEARMMAKVSHPNVCTLYDVGPDYLVMEWVDGKPLAGPLPIPRALEYAKQILEALDAIHQNGIAHRDIKPANILVTRHGTKLVDFGLASRSTKLGPEDPTDSDVLIGQIPGTPYYMAPERLRDLETDSRSDIFSFGCVLYEILCGRRAFPGPSTAEVIAAILKSNPEPLGTPSIDRILWKCLAKDPDQRFSTAQELRGVLLWETESFSLMSAAGESTVSEETKPRPAEAVADSAVGGKQTYGDADHSRHVVDDLYLKWLSRLNVATQRIHQPSAAVVMLSDQVDQHEYVTEQYPPRPALQGYFEFIQNECAYVGVRGLVDHDKPLQPIPIADVYIPLPAVAAGSDTLESAAGQHRCLLVVGDPGSGKSTFLRKIGRELAEQGSKRFPVLVKGSELEEHVRKNLGAIGAPLSVTGDWLLHYLTTLSERHQWGLTTENFREQLNGDAAVVLLDGLDETPDSRSRKTLINLVLDATQAFELCRFVVTTRPAATEYEELTRMRFRTVHIGNLSPQMRNDFLHRWSELLIPGDSQSSGSYAADLINAVAAKPETRRMASNAFMLTAIAIMHWNERKLPEQRAKLVEGILNGLVQAREKSARLDSGTYRRVLSTLALAMQTRKGGRVRQIPLDEAAASVTDCFSSDKKPKRFTTLGERLQHARDFLEAEMFDGGIIVRREDSIEFCHLALQEYLVARNCADLPTVKLTAILFDEDRLYSPEWREVVLFLGGILDLEQTSKLDALIKAALQRVNRNSLPEKARAVGLVGAMLRTLLPHAFEPQSVLYRKFLQDTLGIFKPGSEKIALSMRIEAADALGQAGDPRLRNPQDEGYWLEVPDGEYWMGAQRVDPEWVNYDPDAQKDEWPRWVTVETFLIGRYPVTVQEFKTFLEETKPYGDEPQQLVPTDAPAGWDIQLLYPNRPVVGITWAQVKAFCSWANCRVPTREEWELVARGAHGRKYPWGDQPPEPKRASYSATNTGAPTPVGLFPAGSSPEGIHDLAGNVWECVSESMENNEKRREEFLLEFRGAAFDEAAGFLRAAYRLPFSPGRYGFRCVRQANQGERASLR